MGRRINNDRSEQRNIGFSYIASREYPIDRRHLKDEYSTLDRGTITGEDLVKGIDEIVRRERTTRSEIILRALAVYWYCHHQGNYQTLLPSYDGSAPRSMGQMEAEVFHYFLGKAQDQWEIYRRDIVAQVRSLMGVEGQKAAEAAERIVKALLDAKVKVTT